MCLGLLSLQVVVALLGIQKLLIREKAFAVISDHKTRDPSWQKRIWLILVVLIL